MIAFQGLTSQIKVAQGEKGKWHRVILGLIRKNGKRKAIATNYAVAVSNLAPFGIGNGDKQYIAL